MTALQRAAVRIPALPRMPSRSAIRVFEHDLLVFRRGLRSYVISGLTQPFLYLVSMGLGLGVYVNRSSTAALGGVSYLVFVAPALLITSAMFTAAFETTHPIMAKFEWTKTYWAALNTPLASVDLLAGELLWIAFRLTVLATLFLGVMAVLGAVVSPLAILAIPVAVLTGLAFAAPIIAFTATQRRDTAFNAIFRFGVTPLFLFSGTFFPIDRLPEIVQPLAWATPLWHGVTLARSLATGRPEAVGLVVHLAVLALFVVAGVLWGTRTYRHRLEV